MTAKPKLIEWVKPNGTKIKTNDLPATMAHCESLGWKRATKPRKAKEEA